MAAIVADKMVQVFMVRKTDIAIFAAGNPRTLVTLHVRGKPASVLEQNDLLIILQCLFHLFEQDRMKM
jgi:hypothetical protein